MASRSSSAKRKRVRLPFIIAGLVALVGFGVVSGIALDLATRPVPPPPPPKTAAEAHPSRRAPMPHVVAPEPDEARRAWAAENAAPDQDSPLVAFAAPAPATNRPVLAIVIDDVGLDRPRAMKMIGLPGPLTISMMTYADDLKGLVDAAHGHGHEVMAHLPMEPESPTQNPGPGALLEKMDEAAIRRAIASDLDKWSGYVGINNHMGSRFTADKARMKVVMEELKARGVMWLDSRTTGGSAGPDAAKAAGVPFITRDVFLDNVETVEAVRVQLQGALATAKAHGTAVAIGHPHDATISALKDWLPGLDAAGVTLVPATEILRRRTATSGERAPS